MDNETVAATFAEHENRLKVSEHRIADLEETYKQIQELTISVKELTMSVKSMVEEQAKQRSEQKRQAEQIEEIRNAPDKERSALWKSICEKVAYLVIGGIVTYLFALATGIQL